jgi:hypothetical protein
MKKISSQSNNSSDHWKEIDILEQENDKLNAEKKN